MKRTFLNYNKQELIDKIDLISIEQVGSQVITKYRDVVKSVSDVSNRYEIFDIKSYLKDKIDTIEKNFNITKYYFRITKGVQELTLLSDTIEIEGINFAIEKNIVEDWIVKDIKFKHLEVEYNFQEKVKLYSAEELQNMLVKLGLSILTIYGDYKLNKFDIETSSRLIIIARKL
jgi:hypothetical protein